MRTGNVLACPADSNTRVGDMKVLTPPRSPRTTCPRVATSRPARRRERNAVPAHILHRAVLAVAADRARREQLRLRPTVMGEEVRQW